MKKLIAVITIASSLVAAAAWEKVGSVQIADVNALVAGIARLGEFTGNPMLGLQASQLVTQLPCIAYFGPARAKTPLMMTIMCDGDDCECAFLYPVNRTQSEFLSMHPGKLGKDGVIKTESGDDDDEEDAKCDPVAKFVKFSADGKWVAFGDKAEILDAALADAGLAERPMDGDLARLFVVKSGMVAFRESLEKDIAEEMLQAVKKGEQPDVAKPRRFVDMLRGFETLSCGLSIDQRGVLLRCSVKAVPGSEFDKCGHHPLAADPLAFADRTAIWASAVATDCGQSVADMKEVRKILARHGLKLDFLIEDAIPDGSRFTLDLPAAVEYFKSATNELAKLDGEKLKDELSGLVNDAQRFTCENPSRSYSIAIKGHASTVTPSERIAATLPELATRKPYLVNVGSLYSIFKAVMPFLLQAMPEETRASVEPVLTALPVEGKSGIACAAWREGDSHYGLLRISADEFKSINALVTSVTILQMQQNLQQQLQPQPTPLKSQPKQAPDTKSAK